LLTPLYPSEFYHNYFADDFYGMDPEFGTMEDYTFLVSEIHARGMKIYLDQEIQYVSGNHEWYTSSSGNPDSEFSDFVLYADEGNTTPIATLWGRTAFNVWPSQKQFIYTVNMHSPNVRAYFTDYLLYWMDPNGDGDFSDGADGYRIDHMMDDLDNAGALTDLFARFWSPIFEVLRARRPDIDIVAEQYDWGYGDDFLTRGEADKVFGFPIWNATRALDAAGLAEAITETNRRITGSKDQYVFIENHDTGRFAGEGRNELAILKLGAAVNLLSGWTPIIYYGQEIGMTGDKAEGERAERLAASGDDARDIPLRQAFRWSDEIDADGHALWYRAFPDAYPLADSNQPGDGRSVAEQEQDPNSLLNYYRTLSELRLEYPALATGRTAVMSQTDEVILLRRVTSEQSVWVGYNFSDEARTVPIPDDVDISETILGERSADGLRFQPYGVGVWVMKD